MWIKKGCLATLGREPLAFARGCYSPTAPLARYYYPDHCLDNLYFVVGQPEQFRHDFVDQRVGFLDFCH